MVPSVRTVFRGPRIVEITEFLFRMIQYAPILTIKDSIIAFGGGVDVGEKSTDVIAQYKDDKWTAIAKLLVARQGHAAIKNGSNSIMVVGGPFHT